MKNKEVWVPIQGWETLYEISSLGRIRTIKTGRIRTPGPCSQSYYHKVISLWDKGRCKGYSLSRLVGTHFLPMTGGQVLHIDEDLPEDQVNTIYNLKVGTQSQNIKDSCDKGRKNLPDTKGVRHPHTHLTEEQVYEIRRLWDDPEHPTRKELGVRFGISPETIKGIVLRRTWKHLP